MLVAMKDRAVKPRNWKSTDDDAAAKISSPGPSKLPSVS